MRRRVRTSSSFRIISTMSSMVEMVSCNRFSSMMCSRGARPAAGAGANGLELQVVILIHLGPEEDQVFTLDLAAFADEFVELLSQKDLDLFPRLAKGSAHVSPESGAGLHQALHDRIALFLEMPLERLLVVPRRAVVDYYDIEIARLQRAARVRPEDVTLTYLSRQSARLDRADHADQLFGELLPLHGETL